MSDRSKQARRLDQLDVVGEGIAHVLNLWPNLHESKRFSLISDLLTRIINPELTVSGMMAHELINHASDVPRHRANES